MSSVEPHTHVIIEFYLRVTGSGRGHGNVGFDRGTKKSLLVECVEFLPLYFEIVS